MSISNVVTLVAAGALAYARCRRDEREQVLRVHRRHGGGRQRGADRVQVHAAQAAAVVDAANAVEAEVAAHAAVGDGTDHLVERQRVLRVAEEVVGLRARGAGAVDPVLAGLAAVEGAVAPAQAQGAPERSRSTSGCGCPAWFGPSNTFLLQHGPFLCHIILAV